MQGKRYRTCCTTSLINDSAVRDREAVDNDPKPIVANASEFSEHLSHWGIKFLFSHLLPIYPLVTVGDNNNFILMLYLDCGGGGGRGEGNERRWWLCGYDQMIPKDGKRTNPSQIKGFHNCLFLSEFSYTNKTV